MGTNLKYEFDTKSYNIKYKKYIWKLKDKKQKNRQKGTR